MDFGDRLALQRSYRGLWSFESLRRVGGGLLDGAGQEAQLGGGFAVIEPAVGLQGVDSAKTSIWIGLQEVDVSC